MREMWNPTLDEILEAMALARSRGKSAGDSFEAEFREIMERENKKPFGHTELNPEELAKDLSQKHGTILNINTDEKGVQSLNIIKKEDNSPKESGFDF